MDISEKGLSLIKSFEGLHTKKSDGMIHAYLDPVGIPTVGWGCTRGIKMGMKFTEAQCEAMLLKEIAKFEDAVERLVKVPLNENQFASLVSFSYNVGTGALEKSTLLKELNKGNYAAVPSQLMRWVNAGGKKFPGLVRRRAAEGALWNEPVADLKADTVEEAPELMPQSVQPTTGGVKDAVQSSWTIRGALAALVGGAAQTYDWAFSAATEGGQEAVKLKTSFGPWEALFVAMKANLGLLAAAFVIIGCGIVIVRRLQAAHQGKVG